MHAPYRIVFFDVANTLLYKPRLYARMAEALAAAGYTVPEHALRARHKLVSELIQFPVKTSKEFYDHFNSEFLYALGIVPTKALVDGLFDACTYLEWARFPDVGALENFPLPMGILSNWDETLTEKLGRLIGLPFHPVVYSHEASVAKPSPEIFELAIRRSGCLPGEVLFVGDSPKLDIAPALACGIRPLLIDRDGFYPEAYPDKLSSLAELTRYLG